MSSNQNREAPVRLAMGVADIARAMGLGRSTVWGLVKDGRLKVVKIGGRTLVRVVEAERFLAEQEAATN